MGERSLLVDYGTLYRERFGVLSHAVDRLLARCPQDMLAWNDANRSWLDDYALFMALKFENEGRPWWEWDEALRLRRPAALDQAASKLAHEVAFWRGVQYLFFKQWDRMHDYANEHGVQIIGDMPIYVARDSSDVWASPGEFQLDENLGTRGRGRLPARWLLRHRPALGQPALQLGFHGQDRLCLVDRAHPQSVQAV